MTTDAVLLTALAGNRSRAIAAGVDASEYERIALSLDAFDQWPAAFEHAGEGHLEQARVADGAGRTVSAGEAYLRAAACLHISTTVPVPARDRSAHLRAGTALREGLARLEPDARWLVGSSCVGVLRSPGEIGGRPLVVIVPGLDSSKEEFLSVSDALLRRGVATLSIDGPGQGERAPTTTPVPDHDRVVGEALDAVQAAGLRPGATGLLALSLGGFYGAVALAREPRLRVGVTVSGPYRIDWDALPPPLQRIFALRCGSDGSARAFVDGLDLAEIAPQIRQPLLVVDGEDDVIPGIVNGQHLADVATSGRHLLVPGGDHLVGNVRQAWLPEAADFLAEHLRGEPTGR